MRISDWSSDVCSSDLGWQGDYLGSFGQPIGNMACKPVVLNRVMHRQMTHWGILGSVDGKIIPDSENRFLRESFNFPDSLASLGVSFDSFIDNPIHDRSEEHTSELQSLMRISYAVFCLKKKKPITQQ